MSNDIIRSAMEYSFVELVLIEMVLTLTAMKSTKSLTDGNRETLKITLLNHFT